MQLHLLVVARDMARGETLLARVRAAADSSIHGALAEPDHIAERLAQLRPHVLLLEHEPADRHSVRTLLHAARARARMHTRLLVLCERCSDDMLLELIRLGASGCVEDATDPVLLAKSVLCVADGQFWFHRDSLMRVLCDHVGGVPGAANEEAQVTRLTPREREVISLIGTGMTNKEIARQLRISDKTVQTQLHRIYVKLHAPGRYKAFAAFRATRPGADALG